jgi:hypothetical protein
MSILASRKNEEEGSMYIRGKEVEKVYVGEQAFVGVKPNPLEWVRFLSVCFEDEDGKYPAFALTEEAAACLRDELGRLLDNPRVPISGTT